MASSAVLSPQQIIALAANGGSAAPQKTGLGGWFNNTGSDGYSLSDRLQLVGASGRDDPDVYAKAQALIDGRHERTAEQQANAAQAAVVQRILGPLLAGRGANPAAPPPPGGVDPAFSRPGTDTSGDASFAAPMTDQSGDVGFTAPRPTPAPAAAPSAAVDPAERQRRLAALAMMNPQLATSVNTILQGNQSWKQGSGGVFYDEHGQAQPSPQANLSNVNDTIVDLNDPTNRNRVVQKAPVAGANPVYDNQGRVVDWTLPAGARNAIGAAQRAQADATNASEASYADPKAYGTAAGAGRGGAPYEMVDVPNPDGSTTKMSKAEFIASRVRGLLGGGQAAPGLGTSQTPGNKSYTEDQAKAAAARYDGIQKAGDAAPTNIARYQQLGDLLAGVDGNRFSPTGVEVAQVANRLGFNLDPKLPNKEAAAALTNSLALQLRDPSQGGGMPGSLSTATGTSWFSRCRASGSRPRGATSWSNPP
jgi:hypothetical protein